MIFFLKSLNFLNKRSHLLFRMERVQSRALTCLHSILSTMDAESLGGATALQEAAQHLSSLVFGAPGLTLIKLLLQYYSTICYFSI